MSRRTSVAVALAAVVCLPAWSEADAVVGQAAPEFTLPSADGRPHALSADRGKWVVLEWVNHGCPFVQKHYGSGNMQRLQKEWTAKGVVWLSVNSSAPGKQGHMTAEQAKGSIAEKSASPTAILLDHEGKVGRAYGAVTTPHMFVISPEGKVVYAGAIDDRPSTDLEDVEGAQNYVDEALESAMAGKPVAVATSQPYGCSVKY